LSLKLKIIIILMGFFVLYAAVLMGIHRLIIHPNIFSIEVAEAHKDMRRCLMAIDNEVDHLNTFCWDWASWDETYQFVQTPYASYISGNLVINTFLDNQLNLIYIVNEKNKVTWGNIYDLNTRKPIRLETISTGDQFPRGHPLIPLSEEGISLSEVFVAGIYMTEKGPMIVAARPILTTESKGPIRGTFIMGRFLDHTVISALNVQTRTRFEIFPNQASGLPESMKDIPARLEDQPSIYVRKEKDHYLTAYTPILDIQGNAPLLLRAELPIKILSAVHKTLEVSLASIAASGVVLLLLMLFVMERTIAKPLARLKENAVLVGKTGDFSVPSATTGRGDEIGILETAFGNMLKLLEERTKALQQVNAALERDIEKRRIIEEDLRKTEEKYQKLYDDAPDIYFTLSEKGRIASANQFGADYLGYTTADLVGRPFREIIHPSDQETASKKFRAVFDKGIVKSELEMTLLHKDGWPIHIQVRTHLMPGSKPAELQIICRDINELKLAQEKLKERERYFRSILLNMNDDILIIDKQFNIVDTSKRHLVTVGSRREDAVGQNWLVFLNRYAEQVEERDVSFSLSEVFDVGRTWNDCVKIKRTPATENRWLDIRVSPMGSPGESVQRAIMVLRDVTEEVKLEAHLRQTQKIEAIGSLAGGIAHDFNNILMSVILNTESALRDLKEETPVREGLKISLEASLRAKELVQQILTFSRTSEKDRYPISVIPIVKETMKMLRSSLPSVIEIRPEIIAEADTILANPSQIRQILVNLMTNAGHAMKDKGGTIILRLSEEHLTNAADLVHPEMKLGAYLKLTVEDTGHGISPEVIERIFDPFFTLKKPGEGTGMGLAVIQGIVKEIGGTVAVRSEMGKGSVFDVFLPRIDHLSVEGEALSEALPTGEGCILFIDDEAFLVKSAVRFLEGAGFEVVGCTSGLEALEIFKKAPQRFDLVITDAIMPKMSGIELAQELINIRSDIPVVLCTGFSEEVGREKIQSLGIRSVLMKPVIGSILIAAVKENMGPG
jgi:PAS domain S-box-containing protein